MRMIKRGTWYIRKILIVLVIFLMFFLCEYEIVNSESINDEQEYDEIQYVIDDLLDDSNYFNFGDFVGELIRGEKDLSFTEIIVAIKDGIIGEIKGNLSNLTAVLSIAIIAAIFTNISYAFKGNQVADAGFYVTYLLLFTVLTTSFISASRIAYETINGVLNFMSILIPTYIMALAFSTGYATSYVYYQLTLFLISLVDILLLKIIIPLINIYIIISLANNLSKRDMISKLSELLSEAIKWIQKALLAVVIGLNATSGLISPVADELKKNGLYKTFKAIPGAGEIIGGVAESVVGAGILLKNAIGVAGLVVILIICAVPLLKLGVTTLVYKISSVLIQPISDKRLINCVSVAAHASSLLFNTVIVGMVLFVITITIIAVSTT